MSEQVDLISDRFIRSRLADIITNNLDSTASIQTLIDLATFIQENRDDDNGVMKTLVKGDWTKYVDLSESLLCQMVGIMRSGKTHAMARIVERMVAEGWLVITNMRITQDYSGRNVFYVDCVSQLNKILERNKHIPKQIVFDDTSSYYSNRNPNSPTNKFFNELIYECRKEPNNAQLWFLAHRGWLNDKVLKEMVNYKIIRPFKIPDPIPEDYKGIIVCRSRDGLIQWWCANVGAEPNRPWLKFNTKQQSEWNVDTRLKSVIRLINKLTKQTKSRLDRHNLSYTKANINLIFGRWDMPKLYADDVYYRLKWKELTEGE